MNKREITKIKKAIQLLFEHDIINKVELYKIETKAARIIIKEENSETHEKL